MEIIWKEIPQYPNYEASNTGLIRRRANERILKPKQNDLRPYEYLSIFSGGKKYTKKVAKLIWMAFNECDCDMTIDHIDRNPKNNHIDNLRCISNLENCQNRKNSGWKPNKYNLTKEMKIDIIKQIRSKQKTTWQIMLEYKIPSNYISTVIKRGSWDRLIDG
jgi:hypothetical protein